VTLVKGQPGVRLKMDIAFQGGHRHLPIVTLNVLPEGTDILRWLLVAITVRAATAS